MGLVKLQDQQSKPVSNMWEGVERFLKIVEVTGRMCVEGKKFQHATESQLLSIEATLEKKLSKKEYEEMHARFNTSLNRKLDIRFEELENMIKKLTQQVEQDNQKTKARIDETELNTLWKIKDFSELL
jgi:hypothetical protein